jgi:hypothetical protein
MVARAARVALLEDYRHRRRKIASRGPFGLSGACDAARGIQ